MCLMQPTNIINAGLFKFGRDCLKHVSEINASKSSDVLFASEGQSTSLKEAMRLHLILILKLCFVSFQPL